jgi:HlyD family secretion protein
MSRLWQWFILAGLLMFATGCQEPQAEAETRQGARQSTGEGQSSSGVASVDVEVARRGSLQDALEYTGTTEPNQEISLRSQAEGQVLSLRVDVGDRVQKGQVLAQLDDSVLLTAVAEAEAEADALSAEVAQARAQVSDAQTQVQQARLTLQQAQSDLNRFEQLYRDGAIAQQEVEQSRTEARTAAQALRSAQEVVRTRQQQVATAQRRVSAQQAVVARERERQSYALLRSPVEGVVLQQTTEVGNLAQAGSEILKLGDFKQVKVRVQVSELERGAVRVGQSVQVKLDAFPKQQFVGRVSRISPVADPTARLIPVEVILPNSDRRIGSGLLARVSFDLQANSQVIVPETALQTNRRRSGGSGDSARGQDANSKTADSGGAGSNTSGQQAARTTGQIFVLQGSGQQAKVIARSVTLGQRQDSQVEILNGLQPGDRFVARSSKPLKDGDPVRLSFLSN